MRSSHRKTRGAAAVEMAVVAPFIFLLFLAAFEFARLNMIRHTVEVAAFEGARRGVVPGATVAAVQARVDTVLAGIGVDTATVEIEPATLGRSADTITVRVTIGLDNHTWVPSRFVAGRTVSHSCTLSREQF
ncbi:MAG: pilus assembly protein [Pirellulaceae bacterium]|nr:pilus assembly protein [Pirellulaceae bacterium]